MKLQFTTCSKKLISLLLAIIVIAISVTVIADSNLLDNKKNKSAYARIMERDGFIYGANLPWYKYARNLFGSYIDGDGNTVMPTYDEKTVSDVIENCQAIGLNSINFWLYTYYAGIKTDNVGNILGYDDYFMDNLRATLNLCKKYDITVALTTYVHTIESTGRHSSDWGEIALQPLVNPKIRKQYFDKIITPLCEMLKEYEDIIVLFDVYREPEGQVENRNGRAIGTDWDNSYDFIKESAKLMKKYFPEIPVTAAGGWGTVLSRYNELGLDLNGTDIYESTGKVYDPSMQFSDMPVVCMEYGHDSGDVAVSDEIKIAHLSKTMENFKISGYVGSYYFAYNGGSGKTLSLINSETAVNDLCNTTAVMHFKIIDQIMEYRGIDLSEVTAPDKPALIGSDNPFNVVWFGSRDVDTYKIEGSYNGKNWKVLADQISVEEADEDSNMICSYRLKSIEQGKNYYYRVTATNSDNESSVSEPRLFKIPYITCSDEDNMVVNHSFETGDLTGWHTSASVNKAFVVEKSDNAYDGQYQISHSGNQSWDYLGQTFNVEPDTDYIFTFYAHAAPSYKQVSPPSVYKLIDPDRIVNLVGGDLFYKVSDDWLAYTLTVNSGDHERITIWMNDGGSPELYIDNVFFFKKPK